MEMTLPKSEYTIDGEIHKADSWLSGAGRKGTAGLRSMQDETKYSWEFFGGSH